MLSRLIQILVQTSMGKREDMSSFSNERCEINSTVVRFSLPYFLRDQVVRTVAMQCESFKLAGLMKAKARECCDLVMVRLYVFIQPSQGVEIYTLEVLGNGYDWAHCKDENAMVMKDDGVILHFHSYETRRFTGRDELTLEVRFLVFPVIFNLLTFFERNKQSKKGIQMVLVQCKLVCLRTTYYPLGCGLPRCE